MVQIRSLKVLCLQVCCGFFVFFGCGDGSTAATH